ncbi:MAG TPA: hypothetical protein PK385_06355 [Spirochaetota bacterium]|nr:hypothetical protein [Spirochaetota bacterium]HOS32192.1 hypothetical protein [Spirochaetota bacterium]HOS55663.1 hypothetical protein [Spirochaetota bacterium]HPK61012.1 hypothetical protein [Spirochaetota bacterium]HQF78187.1 hypothetical protein [Spirochaetota bacterium]
MVFAKFKGTYYAIDPTKAVEKLGVKKLIFQRSLKECVKLYTAAPAHIFKIPTYDSEKKDFRNNLLKILKNIKIIIILSVERE